MQLLSIQDPRDNLAKARRKELERFAAENGVNEIDPRMPADLMRKILRQKGLVNIQPPHRPLGAPADAGASASPVVSNGQKVDEVDADSDLMRQWQQDMSQSPVAPASAQKAAPTSNEAPGPDDKPETITDLRKACKARGIKMARTDNMATLRAKLDGADAP